MRTIAGSDLRRKQRGIARRVLLQRSNRARQRLLRDETGASVSGLTCARSLTFRQLLAAMREQERLPLFPAEMAWLFGPARSARNRSGQDDLLPLQVHKGRG